MKKKGKETKKKKKKHGALLRVEALKKGQTYFRCRFPTLPSLLSFHWQSEREEVGGGGGGGEGAGGGGGGGVEREISKWQRKKATP